jgi:hypothetical protein
MALRIIALWTGRLGLDLSKGPIRLDVSFLSPEDEIRSSFRAVDITQNPVILGPGVWNVTSCSPQKFVRHFRGTCRCHFHDLLGERTIPTKRLPLVGEVSANFRGYRVPGGKRDGSLRPYFRISRPEPLLFYQVAPQLYSRG